MSMRGIYASGTRMVRRLIRVMARPVKRDRGSGGVLIQAYRGYGSSQEVYLMGRVFRQPRIDYRQQVDPSRRDLLDVLRRLLRRGVSDAVLLARWSEATDSDPASVRVQTDRDGYFHVRLRAHRRVASDQRWHPIDLELKEPADLTGGEGAKVQGQVFIPPASAQRVIISDIDDTVMYTGVMNKAKMMWRLFMQGPRSRVAFPGVAALYRALHDGPTSNQCNPMLYVSRAPWSIYEILQEFFRLHHIPVGPILFLREWGISLRRPWPRRAEDHKLTLIRDMLEIYPDLPFVLIGDSGQHDPEIYAQVVREHPGRVEAVYIRNVSRSANRVLAIEDLARRVIDSGSTLMLAADTFAMARHAAEHGLIPLEALREVLWEKESDQDFASPRPTREIGPGTPRDARAAVLRGELNQALQQDDASATPPNVSVESEDREGSL